MMHRSEHIEAEKMMLFIDGRLAGEDAAQCSAHLAACPACRDEYRILSRIEDTARALPDVQPPPDFADAVLARCIPEGSSERRGVRRGTERRRVGVWVARLAVPLGIFLIVGLATSSQEPADSSGLLTDAALAVRQVFGDILSSVDGSFWSTGLVFLLPLVLLAFVDHLVAGKRWKTVS